MNKNDVSKKKTIRAQNVKDSHMYWMLYYEKLWGANVSGWEKKQKGDGK